MSRGAAFKSMTDTELHRALKRAARALGKIGELGPVSDAIDEALFRWRMQREALEEALDLKAVHEADLEVGEPVEYEKLREELGLKP